MAESKEKKQTILNAFVMNTPAHMAPGQWRYSRNKTADYTKLSFWTDLAKLLDNAGFHAMFIADKLGPYDVYKGAANVVPALASGAQYPNLIFGVTASLTYEQPYSLARRFSTVDHLSEGRVAWNIVTKLPGQCGYLDSAARNHGLDEQIPHDERYNRAHEYMEVLYKLWEGIHHKGKYFKAGVIDAGNGFGGKHGEAIFVAGQTPEGVRSTVDNIRRVAASEARDPNHVKIIVGITLIVAATDEEAYAKREEYLRYEDHEGVLALFGGWTRIDLSKFDDDADFRFADEPQVASIVKCWASTVPGTENLPWTKRRIAEFLSVGGIQTKIIRSGKTVADELERRVDISGVDGFNLAHITNPGSFEDILEFLLPELRARWLFRETAEKEGATAREAYLGVGQVRLPEDHPGSKYTWRAGENVPKYQEESA
ncbi:luciferase-like domain-containing protein [Aspergillus falconensis]